MGVKEMLFDTGLPGLEIGTIIADFYIDGRLASLREWLNRCVGF